MGKNNKTLTYKEVKRRASGYSKRSQFHKHDSRAYRYALQRGWLDEFFPEKGNPVLWTREKCYDAARQCSTPTEFQRRFSSAKESASREGFYYEMRDQMIAEGYWKVKRNDSRTKTSCAASARNYKTRFEFAKGDNGSYLFAQRRGWLDEICSHMEKVGDQDTRKIYVFEFKDGHAYVGLAHDPQERYWQHTKYNKKSPIFKFLQKHNVAYEYKTLTDWLSKEEAQKMECHYIKKYRDDGWIMLNEKEGGDLGGRIKPAFTLKRLQEIANKYIYKKEFMENDKKAYLYAYRHGFLDEICSHMKNALKIPKKWTKEKREQAIKECKTLGELREKYPRVYEYLRLNDEFEKYYGRPVQRGCYKWNDETLADVTADCDTPADLYHKNESAYQTIHKRGLLEKYFPNYKKG